MAAPATGPPPEVDIFREVIEGLEQNAGKLGGWLLSQHF